MLAYRWPMSRNWLQPASLVVSCAALAVALSNTWYAHDWVRADGPHRAGERLLAAIGGEVTTNYNSGGTDAGTGAGNGGTNAGTGAGNRATDLGTSAGGTSLGRGGGSKLLGRGGGPSPIGHGNIPVETPIGPGNVPAVEPPERG